MHVQVWQHLALVFLAGLLDWSRLLLVAFLQLRLLFDILRLWVEIRLYSL